MRRPRLDPEIFNLPVDKMRSGYYSDKYFVRARETLVADGYRPRVTMQVFGKQHAYLGGIDEAVAILKLCALEWDELEVSALHEGDEVEPWETVMHIEGPYDAFAHLETLYLGVLARRTRVGTNTRRVVEAAGTKEVMFFPARHDHWMVQTGDGYSAHIAGAIGVSTDAQASWWGSKGVGTVPHALIAAYGGDTVLATRKFAEHTDPEVKLVTLVDFENDCVRTSLEVARALGDRLYGVRLDTSEMLVDTSVLPQMGRFKPNGVNPQLVWNVRRALDGAGFGEVRIVVSGGFNVEKITEFEEAGVPVDAYGVGSSLFQGRFDFTADVVRHEGRPCAKVGREFRANPRLERVE
ncbi:MAG: nicotinate phosphoribosyltransferase [Gemmatimonadales bacterium]|nr:nicotinate phosphoribosyltransferase [Gemmatimonadales bacterium]